MAIMVCFAPYCYCQGTIGISVAHVVQCHLTRTQTFLNSLKVKCCVYIFRDLEVWKCWGLLYHFFFWKTMYIWSLCAFLIGASHMWLWDLLVQSFIYWVERVLHWLLISDRYTHLLGFHINVHHPHTILNVLDHLTNEPRWCYGTYPAVLQLLGILLQLSLLCSWLCSPCDVRLVSLAARLVRSWWRSVACWSRRTRSWAGSCHRAASPS